MGMYDEIAEGVSDVKYLKILHIATYIEGLMKRTRTAEVGPFINENALQVFTMTTHIQDADVRISDF